MDKARAVYDALLKIVPHKQFSFAKALTNLRVHKFKHGIRDETVNLNGLSGQIADQIVVGQVK